MPLLVPCDELQPGMRLFEPLVVNGRVMLQGNKALSRADITAVRRRFSGLSVRISDPILDNIIDFEDDSRERNVADEACQMVSESMSQVQKRFAERVSLGGADFDTLHASVQELMEYLRNNRASAALITSCLDGKSYLSTHTGNVFYLSMLLGSKVIDYIVAERRRQTASRDVRFILM